MMMQEEKVTGSPEPLEFILWSPWLPKKTHATLIQNMSSYFGLDHLKDFKAVSVSQIFLFLSDLKRCYSPAVLKVKQNVHSDTTSNAVFTL